jgi:glycosyltransferase involved in cell wall biosynthesis
MKIVINAMAAVAGGSVTYLLNFLPALSEIDTSHEFTVLLSDTLRDDISEQLPSNDKIAYQYIQKKGLIQRIFWEQFVLPLWLYRHGADVLFAPMDVAPVLAPCPVVLAVRNPNPYYEIGIKGNAKAKFLFQKLLTRLSARKARKVIFVSHYARDTIAPQLGIPSHKREVVYHGLDHEIFNPCRQFKKTHRAFREKVDTLVPFVLCVSTIYPHKNYDTLFSAWEKLPERIRRQYKLVIAGMCANPGYCDKLFDLVDMLDIRAEIEFLGRVPYSLVPYLYAQASTFVLPSYLETFGHPLVEAMSMQLPIVASDRTCIPEIVEDAAVFFEADDAEELANRLVDVLTDQVLRDALIDRGEDRSKDFDWSITAKKTFQIIKQASC